MGHNPKISVFDFGNNTTACNRAATSDLGVEITMPLRHGAGP